MLHMDEMRPEGFRMDSKIHLLTWCCLNRFSPSIFSTQLLPLRPASTSLRTLSLPQDPSSWMSSAPAASPSPPSSRTHKPSSSAPAARPFSANQPEERHVSQRAALSAESRSRPPSIYPFCPFSPLRFRSVIALCSS